MNSQYSFSDLQSPPQPRLAGTAMAIDTGSPLVSVAISVDGQVAAQRVNEQRRSSGRLLVMIDEVLAEAALTLPELDLFVALRGPGSFTGLRVGLATVLGTRMALGIATGTLPTLQVLASLAPRDSSRVRACVDALRGEWQTQDYSGSPPYQPSGEPHLQSVDDLLRDPSCPVIGFGISAALQGSASSVAPLTIEPGPLAAQALSILSVCPPDMDPARLTDPLYLQAPAAKVPQRDRT